MKSELLDLWEGINGEIAGFVLFMESVTAAQLALRSGRGRYLNW